tara:strand:+ start:2259 stop:2501 length:243 start_codon:yes stop_codon:yes gene_type:complete
VRAGYNIGDLVHVPQSVMLVDCEVSTDPQLTIPLRVKETAEPRIGVVTEISPTGYIQIYCDGAHWAVPHKSVFLLADPRR